MTKQTRVVVYADAFSPAFRAGGPVRTLDALTASAPRRYEQLVITSDRDVEQTERLDVPHNTDVSRTPNLLVRYTSEENPRKLVDSYVAARRHCPQVVYVNSLFSQRFSLIPVVLHQILDGAATIVLAPRGQLSIGALQFGKLKKMIYLKLFRAMKLHNRIVWHASTPLEQADIEREFGQVKVLIREDDNSLPPLADRTGWSAEPGLLRIAFVSRLVPKKGLRELLEGLRHVNAPVELSVYGSEEAPDYIRDCLAVADECPSNIRIRFFGSVPPQHVRAKFAAADLFVFPTAGENFGHVIPEALSVGCPVALPDTTPWSHIVEAGGGEVLTGVKPEDIAACISRWTELTLTDLAARREKTATAYESWQDSANDPHLYELIEEVLHSHVVARTASSHR